MKSVTPVSVSNIAGLQACWPFSSLLRLPSGENGSRKIDLPRVRVTVSSSWQRLGESLHTAQASTSKEVTCKRMCVVGDPMATSKWIQQQI